MTKREQATEIFRAHLPILHTHGKREFNRVVKNVFKGELNMSDNSANTHCSLIRRELIDAGEIASDGPDTQATEVSTFNGQVPVADLPAIPRNGMSAVEAQYRALETEDDAINRISESFKMLELLTKKCASGSIRGLIVTSGPGVGKTHTVTTALEEIYDPDDRRQFSGNKPFDIIKGSVTAPAMYMALYNTSEEGQVLVLDDADVWGDEEALNLLKAALDDKKIRSVSWRKQSRWLEEYEIPNEFNYSGSVIFLSNLDPSNTRSEKMRRHIEALSSRVMTLDIDITTRSDRLLRIKQVMQCGLLADYRLEPEEEALIFQFVEDNFDDMEEQSLRLVRNIADLYVADETWEDLARKMVLTSEAYYKHKLAQITSEEEFEEEADEV